MPPFGGMGLIKQSACVLYKTFIPLSHRDWIWVNDVQLEPPRSPQMGQDTRHVWGPGWGSSVHFIGKDITSSPILLPKTAFAGVLDTMNFPRNKNKYNDKGATESSKIIIKEWSRCIFLNIMLFLGFLGIEL